MTILSVPTRRSKITAHMCALQDFKGSGFENVCEHFVENKGSIEMQVVVSCRIFSDFFFQYVPVRSQYVPSTFPVQNHHYKFGAVLSQASSAKKTMTYLYWNRQNTFPNFKHAESWPGPSKFWAVGRLLAANFMLPAVIFSRKCSDLRKKSPAGRRSGGWWPDFAEAVLTYKNTRPIQTADCKFLSSIALWYRSTYWFWCSPAGFRWCRTDLSWLFLKINK